MALPTTISGASFPDRNYYCPPVISGGNVYVVLRETTGLTPEVWKATDPTSSFSAQDTSNNPTTVPDAMWYYQDGTNIKIATHDFNGDGGNGEVLYHEFSMSSDTWTITDQTIEIGIKGTTANSASVAIAIRSDGDRIVLYGGDPDADMGSDFDRIDYARWEGASWTVGIDVGGTSPAAENRRGASVVRGSSDNMHFFWINLNGKLWGRTLDPSTNGLSTSINIGATFTQQWHMSNGASFNDSGTQRVVQAYVEDTASGQDLFAWRLTEDGSGDLSASGITQINDTVDPALVNFSPVIAAALDGTTLHVLWSSSSDSDLYRDSAAAPQTSWGTDTEFLDAVTINRISINIYNRGGTKLAMVYDNGGTIQYNEIDLAVGRPPLVRLPRHAVTRAAFY